MQIHETNRTTVPQDQVAVDTTLPARELTAGQLRTEGERSEQLATAFLDSLDEAALSTEMVCHSAEGGRSSEARFAIGDVLWHRVEAELQNREEINALFWQLDIDLPIATVDDWNASKGGAAEANVQLISVRRFMAADCPEAFPWFRHPAVRSEPDGPYRLNSAGRRGRCWVPGGNLGSGHRMASMRKELRARRDSNPGLRLRRPP